MLKQEKSGQIGWIIVLIILVVLIGTVILFVFFSRPSPIRVTESQISDGKQIQLDENQKVLFEIGGNENTLEVSSFEGNSIVKSSRRKFKNLQISTKKI